MVTPRDVARFDGIGYKAVTMPVDSSIVYDETEPNGSAQVGLAAALTGNNIAGLAADGAAIKGRIERVEWDGFATIQIEGYVRLPGVTAATLTRGTKIVGAAGATGNGYIRTANSAVAAELSKGIGDIQDVSDATNVLVRLP
jgi:hypothetical protein